MTIHPTVTVAVPVLNEERRVEACLAALSAQTYPNVVEILVVDGGSRDRTRELAAAVPKVRLLANPARIQAAALNIALEEARGEVFVRVDGHTRIAEDYVARCVEALSATGAAMVGGAIAPDLDAESPGAVGQAVALAVRSPFGVGTARFHRPRAPAGWVETVYLGAFATATARSVGGYDGRLKTNEDAELAWRLRGLGGVWFDPSIRSSYEPRRGLRPLARQFFNYGRGRAATVARHPRSLSARQLAAPALVLALLSPWRRPVALIYGAGLVMATARSGARHWRAGALMPAALATMHLTWGAGFMAGLANAVRRSRPVSRLRGV